MPTGFPIGKRVVWDEALDRRLLLIILASHSQAFKAVNWYKVAELFGNDVTAEACSQHFNLLRRKNIADFGKGNKIGMDGAAKLGAKKTEHVTRTVASRGAVGKGAAGKKRAHKGSEDDEDDVDDVEPPLKRHKGLAIGDGLDIKFKHAKHWDGNEDDVEVKMEYIDY